jgi:hypothetical protein
MTNHTFAVILEYPDYWAEAGKSGGHDTKKAYIWTRPTQ